MKTGKVIQCSEEIINVKITNHGNHEIGIMNRNRNGEKYNLNNECNYMRKRYNKQDKTQMLLFCPSWSCTIICIILHRKASAKTQVSLTKFLQSEVKINTL